MLITKPLEKNDVVTIKMMNGEEILGRFESETDEELIVSRASVVAANPDGTISTLVNECKSRKGQHK
jgi:hypothetical protein